MRANIRHRVRVDLVATYQAASAGGDSHALRLAGADVVVLEEWRCAEVAQMDPRHQVTAQYVATHDPTRP